MPPSKVSATFTMTLFDDPGVREKLAVMDAWEAMCDDERNLDDGGFDERIAGFLKLGKTYKISMSVEEVEVNHGPESD